MSREAYAAAKNRERASASQQAVAYGLERMATAVDLQDSVITALTQAMTSEMTLAMDRVRAAQAVADTAEQISRDAMEMSRQSVASVNQFASKTLWERIRWMATGA